MSHPIPPISTPSTIFALIHDIHQTVTRNVDTALTWDQLNSPPINYTLVRPLVARFAPYVKDEKASGLGEASGTSSDSKNPTVKSSQDGGESGVGTKAAQEGMPLGAVLYALMANRIQFITLAGDLSYAPLQTCRAAFCELLAMKILRTFLHPEDEAELVGELVRGWCAFDGAPEEVWASMGDERKEVEAMRGSALELAIVSTSKHFLSLPLIQHLISQIYSGRLMYIPTSSHSLIADSYVSDRMRQRGKAAHDSQVSRAAGSVPSASLSGGIAHRRASASGLATARDEDAQVFLYSPYEAGWLDHQRLRVPKWRNMLEFVEFGILLALFVTTLAVKNIDKINAIEIMFDVFTLGFILDEFAASKEHGWTVYAANAWNAFDMAYIFIFVLFFALRVFALATASPAISDLAFDILACGACILFPRLVFFLIRDNVVILALRAMIARFVSFMVLTIVAFSGICFCLWTLGRSTWTVKQIVWLMLQIWFGSSYLGFSASQSFHPIFGPIVLISYAALSNTLLITILISMLSNKFAEINSNAQAERVVKTVEGVKSDAVFSYLPPINIAAFLVLSPLSWVCSPRTLHRINVFAIRVTSFPILISISAYERWQYHKAQRAVKLRSGNVDKLMDSLQRPHLFDSFLGGGSEMLIASVFEAGPPVPVEDTPRTPKASSRDAEAGDVTASAEGQTPAKSLGAGSSAGTKFDSPLAKLFGRGSVATLGAAMPSAPNESTGAGPDRAGKEEVDALQKELREVRESQLRMEELLSKLLEGNK